MTYRSTSVTPVVLSALEELRGLVCTLLPYLTWRHHAVGMLQGYVVEGREPEMRVHIWHPDLVRTDDARDGGRPHDHRFVLRSTVLYGTVGHEELHVKPSAKGEFDEYEVQHARLGAAPLRPTGRRLSVRRIDGVINEGYVYEFKSRVYHRSWITGPAVTFVTKLEQSEDPARVLFPVGCEPVFGVQPIRPRDAQPYVKLATELLRG